MIPSEKSNNVYNAFDRYVSNRDKKEIENISKEDIEFASLQYAADKNSAPYIAMQKRIDELNDYENRKHQTREKWKDRAIAFITGLIIGLIIKWLI